MQVVVLQSGRLFAIPWTAAAPGCIAGYMTLNICLIAPSVNTMSEPKTGTSDFSEYVLVHPIATLVRDDCGLNVVEKGDRDIWEISVFSARFTMNLKLLKK